MRTAGTLALALFSPRLAWCSPSAPVTQAPEPANAPTADMPRTAQSAVMRRLRGELELSGFVATSFEPEGDMTGIGWRFALGVGYGSIPITLGLDFQAAYFGEASSRDVLKVGSQALEIEKSRTDSALFLDVFARLQPTFWPVRPFIEGVVGPKRFSTDYSLSFVGGTGTVETTTDEDWTYTLGAGGGLDVRVGVSTWLTAGVRHLLGGRASYSRAVGGGRDGAVRYDTRTTMTTFSLGLVGRFDLSSEDG